LAGELTTCDKDGIHDDGSKKVLLSEWNYGQAIKGGEPRRYGHDSKANLASWPRERRRGELTGGAKSVRGK
jgi:hypothetical protein